ncbi:MAG: tRNA epoxyqueuosine(34) reductase QueG [Gemmatimonadales bacterium]|nr:tRNA epoxyqueuosine(34) reductase QueG [Gemmatimonadales bacterium]
MSQAAAVKRRASELGFLACGITDPSPVPDGGRLDQWLASGYAGVMRYLHRQARKRKDPRLIIPEAKSVVVVLDNYYDGDSDPGPVPKVARYARGQDYHRVTRARLDRLADTLRNEGAAVAHTFTDSGPVPERALALRAGLGWIGKNTMLIRPGTGSFFFIGTIFTDLELDRDDSVVTDHCGSCTRCLDACPTDALVEPRLLDATRCISYLTIEQKGPIPAPLAERLEGWVFGCDICNEVCPWNQRFAEPSASEEFRSHDELAGAPDDLFDRMDQEEFARRFGDTPLERAGLRGMRRNFRAALAASRTSGHPRDDPGLIE